jgi:two-component system response regulator CpxR
MPDDPSLEAPTAVPSLLLVDDDVELCAMVGEFLAARGFQLTYAHDGPSGLGRALADAYELIILDVMLPLLDGFEVLRQIRLRSMVPVIMLTARADERDRIAGLENGADDYLLKPFAAGELLARIHAVSRRARHTITGAPMEVETGPVRLNRQTGDAWCDGKRLELTATEFTILDLLVRSAGRVVTRDAISAVLYQRQATAYERSVDVHMSHLRKKLEREAGPLIRTVRGVGYSLVLAE